jgi:signal transduction histidine kinase
MNWTAQRRIYVGFLLLTFTPILLGLLAGKSVWSFIQTSREVERHHTVVMKLEQLLSRAKDVEVAQREYVITGNETAIATIRAARQDLIQGLGELERLQANELWLNNNLRDLIPQKFEEVERTIRQLQEDGREAALRYLAAESHSRSAMDDIRHVFQLMIEDENTSLLRQKEAQNSDFQFAMSMFAVVFLLNLVLVWYTFYLIRNESARVQALNLELEQRVASRTEELQRSNEELQQFGYVVSHDLKEPMRMIASYSTLLARRYSGQLGQDADTYIRFIVDGVQRMQILVTDLLEYSRAGASVDAQDSEIDANEVLESVLQNLKVSIAEAGATVHSQQMPQLIYDPVRLGQIFQNLISNAIKYRSERSPIVEVGWRESEAEAIFSVRDNGVGIDPKYVDQVFGVFQRLHGKEVEGTGIGLATCKRIVERYGGRIWVESRPGDGSTFLFSMPVSRLVRHRVTTT